MSECDDLPESAAPAVKVSHRQLKLLHLENPLSLRFGNAFFRALPAQPGVYFFHGAEDQLLYIGQSNDLRARVGSYRHVTPEQQPKRTLRLVSKITRIHWEVCATAAEAVERERVLLLEHRPPFNRAGVWKGDPWWLTAEASNGRLELELSREPNEHSLGPLPPAFRYVFGALVRGVYRLAYPERSLASYPHGLVHAAVPLSLRLSLTEPEAALEAVTTFITGQSEELPAQLAALPTPQAVSEQEYWLENLDRLQRYRASPIQVPSDPA
jgi:predicted GIY-YIG superfamily endonuclease